MPAESPGMLQIKGRQTITSADSEHLGCDPFVEIETGFSLVSM